MNLWTFFSLIFDNDITQLDKQTQESRGKKTLMKTNPHTGATEINTVRKEIDFSRSIFLLN